MDLPSVVKIPLMLCFIVSVIVVCVYDGYALIFEKPTISHTILLTAKQWPIFPLTVGLVIGMLLGHLFWR